MKTNQDWSFITQEKTLPKPAMRENKMFHALTSANAKSQEMEIYAATENIMRREKELCQMAIKDLQGLTGGRGDDGTLKMLLDHYQDRMQVTAGKESQLKGLSEDSKKLNEEYRKKNQELAEVKRNLMESQSKMREMAKVTEKLSKKEEELRFIESHLREELEKNRHEMLNGLYEIAAEFTEGEAEDSPLGSKSNFLKRFAIEEQEEQNSLASNHAVAPELSDLKSLIEPVIPVAPAASPKDPVNKTIVSAPLASEEKPPWTGVAPVQPPKKVAVDSQRVHALIERCNRIQPVEPTKDSCSKSLVKSPDGKLLCEYFFPTKAPRDSRQYVFNTVYTLHFLLESLEKTESAFPQHLELAFGDLSSRIDHSKNIHLEAACKDLLNRDSLAKLLGSGVISKSIAFLDFAEKCILRFEGLGPKRIELIEHQFDAFQTI
jgi:F0F1-type ATP synthase membrane subunit b/b'